MLCGKLMITKKVVSNGACPEVTLLIKLKGGSEIPATCLPMMPDARSRFNKSTQLRTYSRHNRTMIKRHVDSSLGKLAERLVLYVYVL